MTAGQAEVKSDWVIGDTFGLEIPAHRIALAEGGADFLTRAFRASGVLNSGNAVKTIHHLQEIEGMVSQLRCLVLFSES